MASRYLVKVRRMTYHGRAFPCCSPCDDCGKTAEGCYAMAYHAELYCSTYVDALVPDDDDFCDVVTCVGYSSALQVYKALVQVCRTYCWEHCRIELYDCVEEYADTIGNLIESEVV